jgi:hypothetical protein
MRAIVISSVATLVCFTFASAAGAEPPKDAASAASGSEQSLPEAQLEFPKPNQGHFVALGAYGLATMAFDEKRGTRLPTFGEGFSLRLGEAITDWLDLSLAFAFGNSHGAAKDSLTFGHLGIQSQWYLDPRWFVQLGLGAGMATGKDPDDLKLVRTRYGDVYWTGVGTHLYLSDSKQSGGWVLSPIATLEVGPSRSFTTASLWLGLEVSWWNGLTKDKLKLPVSQAY